jgi:4-amino-4-deoxy-L-arabinose transferase-like glycosyltransferase
MGSIDISDSAWSAGKRRHRTRRRGETHEEIAYARWARPALVALLLITATTYAWDLSASGYANSFYAAAVQAGTESWKAFFFGSLDSSSFITVDKPPASLWVMALSGRIFGFSSFSMLAPQVLEGVAAVGLLYGSVRRWFGPAAGLAAGAMLALTPVAALMFRFNNPDALLVVLLVAAAYCLTRAIEHARTRWIVACGAIIGLAFLAKMGQAFLVVPAFALAYAVTAPTSLRRRLGQLLAGLGALLVAAGWWVAIVALLPVGSRPFIDGSPDNNIFNLIFGYNGLSRIFGAGGGGGGGAGGGGGGGGGGGTNFSGATGPLRLFNDLLGGQASWLLPTALVALGVGLWLRRGAPRTDRTRAALLIWGGWLLVTAAVFTFSKGVIHTYYTVALAPAIAALVAIGAALLWARRHEVWARACAAATVAGTGAWGPTPCSSARRAGSRGYAHWCSQAPSLRPSDC